MKLFINSFFEGLGAGFGFWVVWAPLLLAANWLTEGRFFEAVLSEPGSYAGVALAAFLGAWAAR